MTSAAKARALQFRRDGPRRKRQKLRFDLWETGVGFEPIAQGMQPPVPNRVGLAPRSPEGGRPTRALSYLIQSADWKSVVDWWPTISYNADVACSHYVLSELDNR
jgi:hypothetical protein